MAVIMTPIILTCPYRYPKPTLGRELLFNIKRMMGYNKNSRLSLLKSIHYLKDQYAYEIMEINALQKRIEKYDYFCSAISLKLRDKELQQIDNLLLKIYNNKFGLEDTDQYWECHKALTSSIKDSERDRKKKGK
jgi:hypothetical protein